MLRSGLVPRRLAQSGIVGGSLALIVKGFKPSQVLHDDGRHTGVDGPLIPVLEAPEPIAAP